MHRTLHDHRHAERGHSMLGCRSRPHTQETGADELGRRISPGQQLASDRPGWYLHAPCHMGCGQEQGAVIPRFPQSGPMRRPGTDGASDGAGVDVVNTDGLERGHVEQAKAERSKRRSRGTRCSRQPKNRSVEGLPTQHNTRAHAVRNSVHIDWFRNR